MSLKSRALFIFRRDLRIDDNTALNAALQAHDEVVVCFVFSTLQTSEHRYRSPNGLAFLIESLEELSTRIDARGGALHILHGDVKGIVGSLIEQLSLSAVFVNKDYTPFSRERDRGIAEECETHGVEFKSFSDALLIEPSKFGKADGKPYTVYTPFFKRAPQDEVRRPTTVSEGSISPKVSTISTVDPRIFWPERTAPHRVSHGGRAAALKILSVISRFQRYDDLRNFPAKSGTTILSPHNKFGTISIREVYWCVADEFGKGHTIIRELFWRDFFTHIAWHFPRVFTGAFHSQYDNIKWENDDDLFQRWCKGTTGFPIVDAGMRELIATGFMHNRVRMIVASFLVKDLLVDWHWGEAFFAQHLTEYDPAVNNGSWQWAASTGCDAQPYFRIFNPWLQQKRFDPECEYIKKWVPELSGASAKEIHSFEEDTLYRPGSYPRPVVEHKVQKILATGLFKEL